MKRKIILTISIVVLATSSLLAQPLPPIGPNGNPVPIGQLGILLAVGASMVFALYKLKKEEIK